MGLTMVPPFRSSSYYPAGSAAMRLRPKGEYSASRSDANSYHDDPPRRRLPRAPQVELLDLGSPFASEPNIVTYDRHVLFTSDDPIGTTRHRAPGPIGTTRIEEAFVHEMPEELVGLVFAQADLAAYACDLCVGVYLVPSALALVDSPEHRSALVVGKLCRHYAPLPLVTPPTVRLPDRTSTCPIFACSRASQLGITSGCTGYLRVASCTLCRGPSGNR